MTSISHARYQFSRFLLRPALLLIVVLAIASWLPGQTCSTGSDLDAAAKGAIDSAATQYLQMSKNGDVAGLKANAIPQLAGDFSSIEQAVVTNKPYLAGGQATIAGTYLLDASQAKAPLPRAEFYCGIYNSPGPAGIFHSQPAAGALRRRDPEGQRQRSHHADVWCCRI